MAPKFSLGNIQFQPPYIGGADTPQPQGPQNQFTPDLLQLLGQNMQAPAAQTGMSKKQALLEILPLLLSGGLGAAFGGSVGAGSALESYGKFKLARDEQKEKRESHAATLDAQRMNAIQRYLTAQQTEAGRGARHKETIEEARARQAAEFAQQEKMVPIKSKAQEDLEKFKFTLGETPVDLGAAAKAAETGEGKVSGRAFPSILSGFLNKQRQEQGQGFQREERMSGQDFRREERLGGEDFAGKQQGRALGVQMSEGEKNRQNARELKQIGISQALKNAAVPGDVQTHIEDLSSLLDTLNDLEAAAPKLNKLIGPIQGYLTKGKQAIGKTSAEEEEILTKVAGYRNKLYKATSGGAVTPSEGARMEEEVMTTSNSPEQFKGRLKTQKDIVMGKLEKRLSMLTPQQRAMVDKAISDKGGASGSFGAPAPGGPTTADEYLKKKGYK